MSEYRRVSDEALRDIERMLACKLQYIPAVEVAPLIEELKALRGYAPHQCQGRTVTTQERCERDALAQEIYCRRHLASKAAGKIKAERRREDKSKAQT